MKTQTQTHSSDRTSKRPRARSSPSPSDGTPSADDAESCGLGEVYLDLFGPPALASTADAYFQAYAVLRSVLEGAPKDHAYAVLDAAEDVAESHVERRLAGGGRSHG